MLQFGDFGVRDVEVSAGAAPGSREGLDYPRRKVSLECLQGAIDQLRGQQSNVVQALKRHLSVCATVIKPGRWDTKGIVTFDKWLYNMPPLRDDSPVLQRRKIFAQFGWEHGLRKNREPRMAQEHSANIAEASQKQVEKTPDELQFEDFEQEDDELTAILEKLDEEFPAFDMVMLLLAAAPNQVKDQIQLKPGVENVSREAKVFHISI